jgi:hypothetical protein
MTDAARRRITISDIMALVAAAAVSMVAARSILWMTVPAAWWGVTALLVSSSTALATTLILIPLRLRFPRPQGERLWRQPGWLACAAVVLALAIGLAQQLLEVAFILIRLGPSRLNLASLFRNLLLRFPHEAGLSVAAAWSTLFMVGGWEPEKGWIDRLGRLLGLYWISYPVLAWIVETVAAS